MRRFVSFVALGIASGVAITQLRAAGEPPGVGICDSAAGARWSTARGAGHVAEADPWQHAVFHAAADLRRLRPGGLVPR